MISVWHGNGYDNDVGGNITADIVHKIFNEFYFNNFGGI